METDIWGELGGIEANLRQQATEARIEAEKKRHEAMVLEGRAAGLTHAADMLHEIETPQ